ncbi:MAG: iron chelate uptake ABC transporter family permease subunit [Anaerovoracaceae bacterium]|jgi:iron complex transport system permease protein
MKERVQQSSEHKRQGARTAGSGRRRGARSDAQQRNEAQRPDEQRPRSRRERQNGWLIALFIILPIVFVIGTICIGRFSVSIADVFAAIRQSLTGEHLVTDAVFAVVMNNRLQRALQGLLVGAALAASGACFQGLFRNPLVSSGMLGVSNGAAFGAALAILLFGNMVMTSLFSFFFGIIAVVCAYFVGRVSGASPTITLVLGGVIVQSIFQALVSLLKYLADPENELPAITYWHMGSLAHTSLRELQLASIPMLIGIVGMLLFRWRLNVLAMGDREAKTLGLDVAVNKGLVIAFATMATAAAISISGVIGWIGLVVPHICRMLIGSDNRRLIPASLSIGGCFLILVDTICRTLTGAEIPLGIVMALVGGPFFIYLLKKTKGKSW